VVVVDFLFPLGFQFFFLLLRPGAARSNTVLLSLSFFFLSGLLFRLFAQVFSCGPEIDYIFVFGIHRLSTIYYAARGALARLFVAR